jgi:hypothetical protein
MTGCAAHVWEYSSSPGSDKPSFKHLVAVLDRKCAELAKLKRAE